MKIILMLILLSVFSYADIEDQFKFLVKWSCEDNFKGEQENKVAVCECVSQITQTAYGYEDLILHIEKNGDLETMKIFSNFIEASTNTCSENYKFLKLMRGNKNE